VSHATVSAALKHNSAFLASKRMHRTIAKPLILQPVLTGRPDGQRADHVPGRDVTLSFHLRSQTNDTDVFIQTTCRQSDVATLRLSLFLSWLFCDCFSVETTYHRPRFLGYTSEFRSRKAERGKWMGSNTMKSKCSVFIAPIGSLLAPGLFFSHHVSVAIFFSPRRLFFCPENWGSSSTGTSVLIYQITCHYCELV
jgi:hypothetical protein